MALKCVRASNRNKMCELFQSHQNLRALPIAFYQPMMLIADYPPSASASIAKQSIPDGEKVQASVCCFNKY